MLYNGKKYDSFECWLRDIFTLTQLYIEKAKQRSINAKHVTNETYLEMVQRQLDMCLEEEDYERAAELRDELKKYEAKS